MSPVQLCSRCWRLYDLFICLEWRTKNENDVTFYKYICVTLSHKPNLNNDSGVFAIIYYIKLQCPFVCMSVPPETERERERERERGEGRREGEEGRGREGGSEGGIMKLCMYVGYHGANNVSNFGGYPVTQ